MSRITLVPQTSASVPTPASGQLSLFFNEDGILCAKDDTGTVLVYNDQTATWGDIAGDIEDQFDLRQRFANSAPGGNAYYFTTAASDLAPNRLVMQTTLPAGGGAGIEVTNATNGTLIAEFCSEAGYPNTEIIPSGEATIFVQARKSAGTKVAKIYAEIATRSLAGFTTVHATTEVSQELTSGDETVSVSVPLNIIRGLTSTDRLIVQIKVEVTGAGTDPSVTIDVQGNNSSRLVIPASYASQSITINGYPLAQNITLTASDFNLEEVDNTSDADKPVSTAQQTAIDLKLDKNYTTPIFFDNGSGGMNLLGQSFNINALQDSVAEQWNLNNYFYNIDTDHTGFDMGTGGQLATLFNIGVNHEGTSDIGGIQFQRFGFNFGNEADAIDIKGLQGAFFGGDIKDLVTISNNIQAFGTGIHSHSNTEFVNANIEMFYDHSNFDGEIQSYIFALSQANVGAVKTNNNYRVFAGYGNVTEFQGNSGFKGLDLTSNLGTFEDGNYNGIYINHTIASVDNAYGLFIDMRNITSPDKWGAYIYGDVHIEGDFSFTGGLSMGQLNAFYSSNPIDGGGNPQGMHGLITEMVALANTTTANCDVIGVNTSMLVQLEENSINTSGAFGLGFTALALPCVVETHTGSSLDFMSSSTYAINLSGTSTGGEIGQMSLSRAVVIPNGITGINRLYGFWAHLPFGGVATDEWGIYLEDMANNYIEGGLKIGGAVGTNDKPGIGLKLHVEGSAKFDGDIGFFNTTPVAQQASSGTATAGALYTTIEQTMIQEMYDALRAYGLLT